MVNNIGREEPLQSGLNVHDCRYNQSEPLLTPDRCGMFLMNGPVSLL